MMAPFVISAEQRNLLYDYITSRLTGLDDVMIVIQTGEFEKADELSLEFSDFLRLLHDDLRWGEERQGDVVLTSPADVLRRSFARLKEQAEMVGQEEAEEWAGISEQLERHQLMANTCAQLLKSLE